MANGITYEIIKAQILNYAQKEVYEFNPDTETFTGDENFTEAIPFFVNLALEKIHRDVQVLDKNMTVNGSIVGPSFIIVKPSLWSQTISLYIGSANLTTPAVQRTPLFKRTYEFCLNFRGKAGGMPQFYCDYYTPTTTTALFSDSIFVAPTPQTGTTYFYELNYETYPPYIDLSNVDPSVLNASWLMQKYPSLLFYASYLEALRYMGKGDEMPLYQGLYEQGVQSINTQNRARNVDRTSAIEKV